MVKKNTKQIPNTMENAFEKTASLLTPSLLAKRKHPVSSPSVRTT